MQILLIQTILTHGQNESPAVKPTMNIKALIQKDIKIKSEEAKDQDGSTSSNDQDFNVGDSPSHMKGRKTHIEEIKDFERERKSF